MNSKVSKLNSKTVFSVVLRVGLCITSSKLFENEVAAKSHCFCGFKLFVKQRGANVTLFL